MPASKFDNHWLYRCDGLLVDPCAHRLECNGQIRRVEPKAYTILVTLLEHAGEVVDRETLLDAAWGPRDVTPGVLSHAISQLRDALGDSTLHPRYIATVHTIGYCFTGEVHRQLRPLKWGPNDGCLDGSAQSPPAAPADGGDKPS